MAKIVLEEFAKELKLIKLVDVAVMVTVRRGFLAVSRTFTMVNDCWPAIILNAVINFVKFVIKPW